MKRFGMAFWVFVVGIAVNVGQILLLSPLLPDPVASHFGANGKADGFMPREAFFAFSLFLIALVSATFWGVSSLIRAAPDAAINLPDKAHWLAPERRNTTLGYIADRMYAFGAATLALFAAMMQQVFAANIGGSQVLGGATILYLVAFLLYTGVWLYGLLRRFSIPAPPTV